MSNNIFNYKSIEDVENKISELGIKIPLCSDYSFIFNEYKLFGKKCPNRLAIAPMEGNDADLYGYPTEDTAKRYIDYAVGGASVIWYEAISVALEGRSNKDQLFLTEETVPMFKSMNKRIKEAGRKANGFEPILIMQANHSGRYSKPNGYPEPLIAYHHPVYEKDNKLDDKCIVKDEYLDELIVKFGEGARLCKEAGFDAYDVKCCHGYIFAELSSAYTREGRYGGSFENRFRALFESIKAAKKYEDENFKITVRLGIYDGFSYPYGFGMAKDGSLNPDYSEAIKVVDVLHNELGIEMINITMGNPYQNSHVVRPFDHGKYIAPEHPFYGIERMYSGIKVIKDNFPTLCIMSSAPTYLREYSPNLVSGAVKEKYCDFVCFGRLSFANPNFPNEIKETGKLDKSHTCITCGKCGDLIRAGYPCGCVIRKTDRFLGFYREYQKGLK